MWEGYKTPRWRRLREKILRRDGYLSQEALRYGRHVEADTVHHIYRAEEYPEFAWAPWNLISITADEHRDMHNPDGSLTELGWAWVIRTHRPPGPASPDPNDL